MRKKPNPNKVYGGQTVVEYKKVLKLGVTSTPALTPLVTTWGFDRLVILRAAINYAYDQYTYTADQADTLIGSIPFPVRRPKRRSKRLNKHEIAQVIAAIESIEGSKKYVIKLLLGMGLRAAECLSLDRKGVTEAATREELQVIRKGNKEMYLPLGSRTAIVEALLKDESWKTLGDLFGKGHIRSQTAALRKWFAKWSLQLSVYVHPHSLRHAFAQKMLLSGANIVDIQTWLGHENIATTRGYLGGDMDATKLFEL